jgi:hypothetical protein
LEQLGVTIDIPRHLSWIEETMPAGCQIVAAHGFDDQMHVIGLDRVVCDTETTPLTGGPQTSLELPDEADPFRRPRAQRSAKQCR